MAPKYTLPALAVALVAGISIAQQTQTQQSSSTSHTQGGSGTATASSSAKASSSQSARAGGTQSGNGSSTSGGGSIKLARPNYAVFYTRNPVGAGNSAATVSPSLFEDQKKYWEMLGEQGNLLYAGPWRDNDGGMMILSCKNDGEAQLIADQDPLVRANLYVANVRAWNVTYVGPGVAMPDMGQTGGNGQTNSQNTKSSQASSQKNSSSSSNTSTSGGG